MPFGRSPYRRRYSGRPRAKIHSIKNETNTVLGITAATNTGFDIAIATDTHSTAVATSCVNGCTIKAFFIEFWYYGLSAGDTNDIVDIYLWKNSGTNLTAPNPGTVGTSNEKRWVIREWKGLGGLKSLGGYPYRQAGRWFRIPKTLQRMATDDKWQLVIRSATTGNFCGKVVYKWYN